MPPIRDRTSELLSTLHTYQEYQNEDHSNYETSESRPLRKWTIGNKSNGNSNTIDNDMMIGNSQRIHTQSSHINDEISNIDFMIN